MDVLSKFLNQSPPPEKPKPLTKKESSEQQWQNRMKNHIKHKSNEYKKWNPFDLQSNDYQEQVITDDPYKTIIVANLNYSTDEEKLREIFGMYGPIKQVRLITDKAGESKGYAFIEYANTSGFKSAFRGADGKKIEGRRVIIDAERGRTCKYWRPRRLGGGRGGHERRAKTRLMRVSLYLHYLQTLEIFTCKQFLVI